jgi:paraquat-inducible protein B
VAFSVPPGAEAGAIADAKTHFTLYPDVSAAQDAIYTKKIYFLLHFSGSVSGLAVGSQVRMQGFQIGNVTDIHIEYDVKTMEARVPITIALEAGRVTLLNDDTQNEDAVTDDANVYSSFRKIISHGLRAKLGSVSLLTGQKVINLDFVNDVPPGAMIEGGVYPEIPTMDPEDVDSIIHATKELLDTLQVTASTLNKAIASPEMNQSLRSLNETLANLDHITHDASISVGPLLKTLQAVALSADNALKQVNVAIANGDGGGDLAGALHELKNASRSVRVLTDYLESHPEVLLMGKPASTVP